LTYQQAPDSFIDADQLLRDLQQKSKEELLELLRQMILAAPACLRALGLEEFEETGEKEAYEEAW
jgi:hypothetical protein